MVSLFLMGILNVTPDSFSDGGTFIDPEQAAAHARQLIEDGAAIVDIGADSSRPGSLCVGEKEEWARLAPVLEQLDGSIPISIDTHFESTARRAIQTGKALWINDISGGSKEMFELVADTGASLIVMYSRCTQPHEFDSPTAENIADEIQLFFDKRIELAEAIGLPLDRLIFDPGLGSFLSPRASDSLAVLDLLPSMVQDKYKNLCVGISRKGFLKHSQIETTSGTVTTTDELDYASVILAKKLCEALPETSRILLRVHNVALHAQELPWLTRKLPDILSPL